MSDNINNSNPFDPASLRLNQSFTDGLWVKKLLTTVRYATRTAGLCAGASRSGIPADTGCRHRGHREVYLATPDMAVVLPGEFNPVTLYTAIRGVVPVAREAARPGREAQRLASLGGRSARTGDETVGAGHREHVARRLRWACGITIRAKRGSAQRDRTGMRNTIKRTSGQFGKPCGRTSPTLSDLG